MKNKQVVTFLSGSAGELDWILPILDYLSKLQFKIKIIYLSRHVQKSVNHNRMLSDYINQPNNGIETISCGGYFTELIEKYGYLMHRINIKLNKPKLLSIFFYIVEKVCKSFFINNLPKRILQNENDGTLIFSEHPSLRRPRDKWIKQKFNRSIFFYHPHSPHIYATELGFNYSEPDSIDLNKKYFLLLGHPADHFSVDDKSELAAPDLAKVFIGHPKYSNRWLHNYQEAARLFRSSFADRMQTNILVISRGIGSYIDQKSQKDLIETTANVIHNQVPNYKLFVKKHPREFNSHWDNILDEYPSIRIVKDHILDIASKVDFVITFWSSGAMDCFNLGVPTIEYYDPNKNPKQQLPEGDSYTTIYRKLGIVLPANNEEELELAVSRLVSEDYKMPSDAPHSFYSELIFRSNQWDKTIDKILVSHNLIND